jgi:hypothetical protein
MDVGKDTKWKPAKFINNMIVLVPYKEHKGLLENSNLYSMGGKGLSGQFGAFTRGKRT